MVGELKHYSSSDQLSSFNSHFSQSCFLSRGGGYLVGNEKMITILFSLAYLSWREDKEEMIRIRREDKEEMAFYPFLPNLAGNEMIPILSKNNSAKTLAIFFDTFSCSMLQPAACY